MKKANSDVALAELAMRAHAAFGRSTVTWMDAAGILLEARRIAEHGQWRPFLAEAGIPNRTAERMLRIAKTGLKSDNVSLLGGVAATLDHIAAGKAAHKLWRETVDALPEGPLRAEVIQMYPDGPEAMATWARLVAVVNEVEAAEDAKGVTT